MQNVSYQFEVIFIPQEEGGFTVEVPDLPGCISEGDSLFEAEENIKEAMALYLEELEESGLPVPERDIDVKILKMNIPKLPVLKPKEIIVILKKHGFLEKRQKGSHVLFVNQKINKWTTVPVHNKP